MVKRFAALIMIINFILISIVFANVIDINSSADLENSFTPLITEVYYDTYRAYEPDEYIKIYNPADYDINISGWKITDLEGVVEFPERILLAPKSDIYIAKNGSAFYEELGFYPDFEYEDSLHEIPNLIKISKSPFQLSNSGDEVVLKDSDNNTIDVVIYGSSAYSGDGWNGKPAENVIEGALLKRKSSESSGEFMDTDTASDWDCPRIYKILQSGFQYQNLGFNGNVTAFVSPDSSFNAIANELENAKESIFLCLYQLTNTQLARYLACARERGVCVKILLEGAPVGWNLSNVDEQEYYDRGGAYAEAYAEKYISAELLKKGCDVRFMVSDTQDNVHARYAYLHAKYAVIDNCTAIISSDNWKPTGIPADSSYGDRGWGVVIRSPDIAKYFAQVFFEDFDLSKKDIMTMSLTHEKYSPPPDWFVPNENILKGSYKSIFSAKTIEGEFTISPILSPDTSLLETKSIIGVLNSAQKSICIELLGCSIHWDSYPNLYLESAINASRRGCKVKILLDGEYIDAEENKTANLDAAEYVNNIARAEHLDLEARVIKFEKNYLSKIHNKGILVDGEKVVISSINWNYNSVAKNREAGVIIENKDAAEYFENVFLFDWGLGNERKEDVTENENKIPSISISAILIIAAVAIVLSGLRDTIRRNR